MQSHQRGLVVRAVRCLFAALLVFAAPQSCSMADYAVTAPAIDCGQGEWPTEDGSGCEPAGVSAVVCREGFLPDGDGGCAPILPAETCPKGLMAVPGDIACREVAPCGAGKYGDIPVDEATQFVDGSYAGNDSDGTVSRPWRSIQQGIHSAEPGAIVAVAAGIYNENLSIIGKRVRVWGVCPARVKVVSVTYKPVIVLCDAHKTEIRDLAIAGGSGIRADWSAGLLVDRVWIHDTSAAFRVMTTKSCDELSAKPIIHPPRRKKAGWSPEGTVETTADATDRPATEQKEIVDLSVTIRGSLLEGNRGEGISSSGVSVVVDGTVVRRTPSVSSAPYLLPSSSINIDNPNSERRVTATVRGSVVEQATGVGIHIHGIEATIETTLVRDTLQHSSGQGGEGISIEYCPSVRILGSILTGNHGTGLHVLRTDATVEAIIVDGTLPDTDGSNGRGISIERAKVLIRGSMVTRNHDVGLCIAGADVNVADTVVRGTLPDNSGFRGRGINISASGGERSSVSVRRVVLEGNHEIGLCIAGSDATVDTVIIRATKSNTARQFGDGIAVVSDGELATAFLANVQVEDSENAGISNLGGKIGMRNSSVVCSGYHMLTDPLDSYFDRFYDLGGNACGCPDAAEACEMADAVPETPPSQPPR